MKILRSVSEVRAWRASIEGSCGFVPTMGALHAGHVALIERCVEEQVHSIVSIFVNPTQFNDPKDFEAYPISLDEDFAAIETAGVDVVFVPDAAEIYTDAKRYSVAESEISRVMEGVQRPGHFDGVLTVVMKLLNIVSPQIAYFGEKDFQQYLLIKDMVAAFFMDYKIVASPTVRAEDGLALSSRNRRLGAAARALAPELHKQLASELSCEQVSQALSHSGFEVEYIEEHWGRRFGAVQLDGVRLIDNIELQR